MTVDSLTWFQIAARLLILVVLVLVVATFAVQVLRRIGGLFGRRPRIVTVRPPRPPQR
ncbi:cadmium ABC transporter ATPase [Rhodopseudomonas sp. BR0M22]|uniref:cadmium ABC transporter ATPase n=2 Tax=unclassified Rhodopseudomonas TaxID=2638247 RepID=UPI0013E09BC1|nr:cadmium ABC transporter ATPase [Rhodopseudomonas sp. BR0M22]MCD0420321.1 hypothetical protein [Rubrivivax sp. JA1024]